MQRHHRHRPLIALASLLLAMAAPPTALAAGEAPKTKVTTDKVSARIVTDVSRVAPGARFRVGIHFETEPHWHIYWRHPGDTGIATEVTFQAPDGYHFGEVRWPTPRRFVDALGGSSYGYADEVLLFADVTAPADALEGSDLRVDAHASWLVCKENCIKGRADLALTLPVASPDPEGAESADRALFAKYAAAVPVPLPEGIVLDATLDREGVRAGESFAVTISVHDPSGAALTLPGEAGDAFFPAPAAGLRTTGVEVGQAAALPAGGLALEVSGEASRAESKRGDHIDAVLALERAGEPVFYEARVPIPRLAGVAEVAAVSPAPAAGSPHASPPHASSPRATSPRASSKMAAAGGICATAGAPSGPADAGLGSLWLALLFAFVGGVILNAMPCVLPVLSIKILSLVEQSDSDRKVIWRHGVVYTAGVLASFLALAILMISLQATNWAFQMQDPLFVAVFAAVVFAFALSLFGVFEVSLPGATRIEGKVAGSHGYMSSFNYGIFAVLLGTPCTAPFLGPAMTYAFTQPPLQLTLLLLTVGLGLASPFLLLAAFPQWKRLLPRPGPWLTTFKKVMGFLLVGTAVFLVHTLNTQVSRGAMSGYLVFLAILALGLWVYGHWGNPIRGRRSRYLGSVVAVAIVVGGAMSFVSTEPPAARAGTIMAGGIAWHDFDQLDVKAAAAEGRTVFIDFTAEWCATCKVNENTAIYNDTVRALFDQLDVMPVKADFTINKPQIGEWLERFDEPSVPLYVVLPAGKPDRPIKLPTLLSTQDVVNAVCEAGPSKVQTASR